jgi:hypothetical protein
VHAQRSAEPNWLVREVDRFLGDDEPAASGRPVDFVVGPAGAEDRFLGRLVETTDGTGSTCRQSLGGARGG